MVRLPENHRVSGIWVPGPCPSNGMTSFGKWEFFKWIHAQMTHSPKCVVEPLCLCANSSTPPSSKLHTLCVTSDSVQPGSPPCTRPGSTAHSKGADTCSFPAPVSLLPFPTQIQAGSWQFPFLGQIPQWKPQDALRLKKNRTWQKKQAGHELNLFELKVKNLWLKGSEPYIYIAVHNINALQLHYPL